MKTFAHVFFVLSIALGFGLGHVPAAFAAKEVTCECLESHCGKCEIETGVDFYTEKCGRGDSKVKSCKRPQCKQVTDYDVCLAKLDPAKVPVRAVASAPVESPRSADVILALGHSHLERGDTKTELAKDMKVFAGDKIVTAEDGRVRIRFQELSEIFISPSSSLVITEALIEKRKGPSKRTILLDLQKGRLRSRVQGRYNQDSESKFEVKTRSAVAGVRGTEFVVSFEQSDAQWKTEVRTLRGEVSLDGIVKKADGKRDHATVSGGTFAALVIPSPPQNSSAVEVEAALRGGYMTDVQKLTDQEMLDFDDKTFSMLPLNREHSERKPASKEASNLCRAPAGAFNQCSWTCEGNPKGAKSCRSDLQNVKCVRRLCRASGEWAEPTVLPVKDAASCDASGGAVVGDCGGYW